MTFALRAGSLQRTASMAVLATLFVAAATSASPPLASGEEPFVNGTATATAIVNRVAPGVGSLSLAITGGVAVAEVRNQLAQAKAQSVDLGLIGGSLTAAPCDGSPASITPDDLPQPTRVDNRKGDASAQSSEIPVAGSNLSGGREEVRATKQPLATATASNVAGDFGGVVKLGGGKAEASTRIVDGKAREAVATVEGSVDIAGIVKLGGMKWSALHRTGARPSAVGTFELGSAAAFGAPISTNQLQPVEAAVNSALVPTGIRVEFPQVQRFTQPTDLIRVTPLRIVVENSPAGATVLGPVLGITRTQREQLFDAIVKQYCRASSALLVGDITISVASGTGFLAMEVGGVEATTAATNFENPFGSDAGFLPALGGFPGLPPLGAVLGAAGVFRDEAPTAAPGRPTAIITSSGPLRSHCESLHASGTACSRGSAVMFGLLGLAAVVGVGALDWQRQRRARTAKAA